MPAKSSEAINRTPAKSSEAINRTLDRLKGAYRR
jgi:hypothetical protein